MRIMKTPGPCAGACLALLVGCAAELPENDPVSEARWLPQNWSPEDRFWFHHASRGTASVLVPYDWFLTLEQPTPWLFGDAPLFSDPEYLARYGFIPGVKGLAGDDAAGYQYGGGRDGPRGNGVIGPALSEGERWDLIEYLKGL